MASRMLQAAGRSAARRPHASSVRGNHPRVSHPIGHTLLCAAALAILPHDASAGACVDYSEHLRLVGTFVGLSSTKEEVAVAEPYAYVAGTITNGVQILNISNPNAPSQAGSFSTPDDARGMAVTATHLYVASGNAGLVVATRTNPTSPVLRGVANTPGTAYDVAISGNLAYVADGISGLTVVDVTNDSSPTVLGSVATPLGQAAAVDVAVRGDYAYLAYEQAGLVIVDVSIPTAPVIVSSIVSSVIAVTVDDTYVYAGMDGLSIIDASDPELPVVVGNVATAECFDVKVSATHAFLAANDIGMEVVDITNPTAPAVVGRAYTQDRARGVAISGTHAFLPGGHDQFFNFAVVDISNPSSPPILSGLPVTGFGSIEILGTNAYVLDFSAFNGALKVIDLTNPAAPQIIGMLPIELPVDLALAGSQAYVTAQTEELLVVDISNPAAPTLAGSVDLTATNSRVVAAGSYAYVAEGSPGMRVVDVSNPSSPVIVGSVDTPGTCTDLTVAGQHVYIADGPAGMKVVDVSNPTSPAIIGTLDTPGTVAAVAIDGTRAYLIDNTETTDHLRVASLFNPAQPLQVGALPIPGGGWQVAVADGFAYVAGPDLQVAGILPLSYVGSSGIPNRFVSSFALAGDYVCLTAGGAFFIVPAHCPATTAIPLPTATPVAVRLAQNWPNPFDPAVGPTEIQFTLTGAGRANLRMFDVTGRQVRLLVDQVLPAGEHSATWDGRNDRGGAVGSGIYFYRLEAGDVTATQSLVKVR